MPTAQPTCHRTRRGPIRLLAALLLAGSTAGAATAPVPVAPPAGAAAASKGVHTLYLVRHGAYDSDDPRDAAVGKALLPIGIAQARLLGARLHGMPVTFSTVLSSPLTRARETAAVVVEDLPGLVVRVVPELEECTPPTRRQDIMAEEKPEDLAACQARLEKLFADVARPTPDGDRHELLVCHGNVIRYLVTKALGVDTMAWLGMSIGHASLTTLSIDASGAVRVIAVGDVGHLPTRLQTGAFGNPERDLLAPKPAGP